MAGVLAVAAATLRAAVSFVQLREFDEAALKVFHVKHLFARTSVSRETFLSSSGIDSIGQVGGHRANLMRV